MNDWLLIVIGIIALIPLMIFGLLIASYLSNEAKKLDKELKDE